MLGKLIKYDLKSTYREFVGIFMAMLLGVTIIPLIFKYVNNQMINLIAGLAAFAIVIAVVVIVISSLFQLFNTNLFSKQGYLSRTLPVTSRDIVISKLITSSMWIVLTGIVSIFSLLLLSAMLGDGSFKELLAINFIPSGKIGFSILLVCLLIVAGCIKEMSKLFMSCSISHLKAFHRFRIPAGILSYFILSWIETLLLQIGFFVIKPFLDNNTDLISHLETFAQSHSLGAFNFFIGGCILYGLILIAFFSTSTIWLLDHRLDLD